jgi:hypothetical protein
MRYGSGFSEVTWISAFRKLKLVSFLVRLMVALLTNYHVGDVSILRTDCAKDHGVELDSRLYFHQQANYIL